MANKIIKEKVIMSPEKFEVKNWLNNCQARGVNVRFGIDGLFILNNEIIDKLYEMYDNSSEKSPFILNYKEKLGHFAIRHYYTNFFNEYYNYIFNPKGSYEQYFDGFHDGGKLNITNSQLAEFILAFGINLLSRKNIPLMEAFNTAIYGMKSKGSKKKIAHESELQGLLFSKTEEACQLGKHALAKMNVEPYNNIIASKCYKGLMIKEFYSQSDYKTNSVESKTDVVVYNKDTKDIIRRISVKYGKNSQGCSALAKELKAIFSTLDLSKAAKWEFNALIDNLYEYKGRACNQTKEQKAERTNKQLHDNMCINNLFINYEGSLRKFLIEVLTGEHKFGKESINTADDLFIISTDLCRCERTDIIEYIDENIDNVILSFSPKSTQGDGGEALRYTIKHNDF